MVSKQKDYGLSPTYTQVEISPTKRSMLPNMALRIIKPEDRDEKMPVAAKVVIVDLAAAMKNAVVFDGTAMPPKGSVASVQ